MAPQISSPALFMLQTANKDLAAASPREIAVKAHSVAQLLPICAPLFSTPSTHLQNESREVQDAVTRWNMRVSALLHGQAREKHLAGCRLAKATLDAGGVHVLRTNMQWIRSTLTLLSLKGQEESVQQFCILNLLDIFTICRQDQALFGETLTNSLKAFIDNCVKLSPSNNGVPVQTSKVTATYILHALNELLPFHATLFRPYLPSIRKIILHVLALSPSATMGEGRGYGWNLHWIQQTEISRACQLFTRLHYSFPKKTQIQEWEQTYQSTLLSIHTSLNIVFRSVNETWKPTSGLLLLRDTDDVSTSKMQFTGPDQLGMIGWEGLHAGVERVTTLLLLLQQFVLETTVSTVTIPLNDTLDLIGRLLAIIRPSKAILRSRHAHELFKPDYDDFERQALFFRLADLHSAAISLLTSLLARYQDGMSYVVFGAFQGTLRVYDAEMEFPVVHLAVNNCIKQMVDLMGASFSQAHIFTMRRLLKTACSELLPKHTGHDSSKTSMVGNPNHNDPSRWLDQKTPSSQESYLRESSAALLISILSKVDAKYIPAAIRSRIDRTSIITRNKDLMLASVMNPPPSKPSILPFLVQAYPDALEVQALLAPRMPLVQDSLQSANAHNLGEIDKSNLSHDEETVELSEDDHMELENGTTGSEVKMDDDIVYAQSITEHDQNALSAEILSAEQTDRRAHSQADERIMVKVSGSLKELDSEPQPTEAVGANEKHAGASIGSSLTSNIDMDSETRVEDLSSIPKEAEPSNSGSSYNNLAPLAHDAAAGVEDDSDGSFELGTFNPEPDTEEEEDL